MVQWYERTTEDLEKDVEELTNIAFEDKIQMHEIRALYHVTEKLGAHEINQSLNQKVSSNI
jgi:hypothetical protein